MTTGGDDLLKMADEGYHGKVRGACIASDGIIYESGYVSPMMAIPTLWRAEHLLSRSTLWSDTNQVSSVRSSTLNPSLAGKFIVRK